MAEAAPFPAPEQTPASEASAPQPSADTSGWYRNRSPVELLVQPDRYPSARLDPGESTWLPADPQHPHLEPCDPPAAADTQEQ